MTSALPTGRWSRRTFLLAAIGSVGPLGLVACSAPGGPTSPQGPVSDPAAPTAEAAGGGASPQPAEPSASVFPGSVEAAAIEDSLAAHAATVLAVGGSTLGKAGRQLVTAIRDQHVAHAAALRTTDPTDPNTAGSADRAPAASPSTSPSGKKPGFAKAVDQLRAAETKAAVTHRSSALAAEGLGALLWGSLSVSASQLAGILKTADLAGDQPDPSAGRVAATRPRAPMPLVPTAEGEQQMVRQLHAVVYGYQLALGRLTGARRDAAAAELKRHRILRDQLTVRLLNRKASVPVADPAYVPSTNPRNAAAAAKLIRQMETALVPFCGLWLAAAADPAERSEALGQVARTVAVARQWGASLPAWPGWKPA
ncbi:MAG TPA: DUF4439 domain-containing protein [Microlunatus sp.]